MRRERSRGGGREKGKTMSRSKFNGLFLIFFFFLHSIRFFDKLTRVCVQRWIATCECRWIHNDIVCYCRPSFVYDPRLCWMYIIAKSVVLMVIMSNDIAAIFILSRKISITHGAPSHTWVMARSVRCTHTHTLETAVRACLGNMYQRTVFSASRPTIVLRCQSKRHCRRRLAIRLASITLLHCIGAYSVSMQTVCQCFVSWY